jgi:HEAT repeat protein
MALGQIGDTRAMRPLIAALQDPYSIVHQEAAQALHRLDTPEARAAVRNYKKPAPEG